VREGLFLGRVLFWPQGSRTQHYWPESGADFPIYANCASATAFYISSKSLIFLKVGRAGAIIFAHIISNYYTPFPFYLISINERGVVASHLHPHTYIPSLSSPLTLLSLNYSIYYHRRTSAVKRVFPSQSNYGHCISSTPFSRR
jgi:hypothetical protein